MILVTGPKGFVGHKLMELCEDVIAAPSLRNASEEEVKRIVEESGADVVIHTAAISDIGACAKDPDASYAANVLLPVYLARACKDRKLVCFSSDQVYSACEEEGPYTEEIVKPGNLYAEHKLEMENRVLDLLPDSVMLRAEWMYDLYQYRDNYFTNMINAKDKVIASSVRYRGLTYVKEVAESMKQVVKLPGGAYNFGSETRQSMYDITREFLERLGRKVEIEDTRSGHNLWMNCQKARSYGVDFSDVLEGLLKCAEDYKLL